MYPSTYGISVLTTQRAILVSSGLGSYIPLPFPMLQGGPLPHSTLSLCNCTVQNTPSASNVTNSHTYTPSPYLSTGAKKTNETCPVGQIVDSGNMPGLSLTIRLKISRVCGAGSYHTAVWEHFLFFVNHSHILSHLGLRSSALMGTSRNQTILTARQAKQGRPPSHSPSHPSYLSVSRIHSRLPRRLSAAHHQINLPTWDRRGWGSGSTLLLVRSIHLTLPPT